MVELLQKLMRDREEVISCFVYQMNFGKDYDEDSADKMIDKAYLKSAELIYDHLMECFGDEEG